MPQRWFIRNASTDRLTGRHPHSGGCKYSVGHVTEMTGHVPEFGGHDAETAGHDGPKYARRTCCLKNSASGVVFDRSTSPPPGMKSSVLCRPSSRSPTTVPYCSVFLYS